MLSDHSTHFRQGHSLGIVASEPQAIARVQPLHSDLQRLLDAFDQSFAVRVTRLGIDSRRRFLLGQRFDAPARSKGIYVTLGENGPEPRREAAAPVAGAKQRARSRAALVETAQ